MELTTAVLFMRLNLREIQLSVEKASCLLQTPNAYVTSKNSFTILIQQWCTFFFQFINIQDTLKYFVTLKEKGTQSQILFALQGPGTQALPHTSTIPRFGIEKHVEHHEGNTSMVTIYKPSLATLSLYNQEPCLTHKDFQPLCVISRHFAALPR